MASTHQVIPQPPQIRPVGPTHDGFAPNEALMTPDKIASIQERIYPKWMYCDGEEPLLVLTPEVEETLGSGWRETLEDPNKPAAPVAVPKTREEYYQLNQADVLLVIAQVTDPVVLQRMRTSEVANPRRPNGRPAVLDALTATLTPLEPADAETSPPHPPPPAPVAAELQPAGPPVATAPAVEGVDESELDPLPAEAPAKATRGKKQK